MAGITRQDALKIATKLKARIEPGRGHGTRAEIYYQGRWITWFGISRSPKKDKPQGHIPRHLHQTPHETKDLAQCPKSREDWIADMIEKGIIKTDAGG